MNLNKSYIFSILSITIFIFPVIYYGIKDLEEYQLGYFTLKTYIKYPESFWHGYYDLYGPGVKLPIGHFPIFHPANFFFFNTQIHYFFLIFINIFGQVFFFKKILEHYDLESDNYLFIFIIIFSITNFNYFYSDDWSSINFCYSTFFPIFYYLAKSIKFNNSQSILKLFFWLSFQFINGHLGTLTAQYIFLLVFFLSNKNSINLFSNKYFYIGCTFVILISINNLIFLYSSLESFPDNIPKVPQKGYNFKDFYISLIYPLNDLIKGNRSPYFNIIFIIAIYVAFKNIKNLTLKPLIISFIVIVALSTDILLIGKLKFLSAIWILRDYFNIISLIFFCYFFQRKKFLIKLLLTVIILIQTSFFIKENLTYIDYTKKNFIAKNIGNEDKKLIDFLEKNKINKKIYLGTFNEHLRNSYRKYGIYAVTDLIDYNIYPFNGWFKNISFNEFFKSEELMHSKIYYSENLVNNQIFLKNFLIEYLILYNEEIKDLKINFSKIDSLKIEKKTINLLKLNLTNGFPSLKNEQLLKEIKNKCSIEIKIVQCIMVEEFFILDEELSIKVSEKELIIRNNSDLEKIIFFPFSDYKNWGHDKHIVYQISPNFYLVKLEPKSENKFIYNNKTNLYLNFLSIILLITLIILIIFNGGRFKKNIK